MFTLRFLWHANRERLPYRILIADGQVHPRLAELLGNSHTLFPELDIEYVRYPDDADFSAYFKKMADAMRMIRTPYAMLADNDDFIGFAATERNLDFLDANPDFVCCGGGVAGFSVYAREESPDRGLQGRLNRYAYRYTIHDRSVDFDSASAVERLRQGSRSWWPYYAVFRADALAKIWRESEEISFSDLQLHEFYSIMRTLTLGKAHCESSTISYLRQYGTSMQTSFSKDWVHHLLRSRFTCDFAMLIDRISAAATDCTDTGAVAEMLRGICEQWLREFLRVYYGPLQTVKQFMRENTPSLFNWLKNRRRYLVSFERAGLFSRLTANGASVAYLTAFRAELGRIEEALTGEDFAAFVRPYISVLGDHKARPAVSSPAATQALDRSCA